MTVLDGFFTFLVGHQSNSILPGFITFNLPHLTKTMALSVNYNIVVGERLGQCHSDSLDIALVI